jgi:hypothetical protein
MPKKMSDGASKIARLNPGENTPPLLSEKLIAQLQGAVEAAQRRRIRPQRKMPAAKDESSTDR